MDSDQGKLFIGGISWETSEDKLKDYFSNYGEVMHTVVMRDKITSRPRGFGFVVFADPSVLDRVLQDKHTIDGKTVRLNLVSLFFFRYLVFCPFWFLIITMWVPLISCWGFLIPQ